MKNILIVLSLILTLNSFGQDLNDYDYVVVPEKFSFLKEADQHQLNSLTKFLFEKYGFNAFIEGEEELVKIGPDRCNGLYADVLNDSNMFRTRLSIILKDCRNRQLFTSTEGVSRAKDFGTAYQEALREAFKSIEALKFSHNEVIVSGTPEINVQAQAKTEQVSVPSVIAKGEKNPVKNQGEVQSEITSPNKNSSPGQRENLAGQDFLRDGRTYFIQKSNNGFNLFHKGTTEPFATLIRSSAGNSFIYNSMTAKGIACFDVEGNLVIEILKEDGNSIETVVYKAQDQ